MPPDDPRSHEPTLNPKALLNDLKPLARTIEADILEVTNEDPDALKAVYDEAKEAGRTGHDFTTWREDRVAMAAASWILACVFVRFIEDNQLVPEAHLSGPGPRRQEAMDRQTHFFTQQASATDRDYLLYVFEQLQPLPGMGDILNPAHNPLYDLPVSPDGAAAILKFFRTRVDGDEEAAALAHDFTDPSLDTRFLGDLYQDLSELIRKQYALLQTPDFIEAFILDRTLDPAIETFGLDTVRLIDPTCGSGHFLLGAFHRLLARWQARGPATPIVEHFYYWMLP